MILNYFIQHKFFKQEKLMEHSYQTLLSLSHKLQMTGKLSIDEVKKEKQQSLAEIQQIQSYLMHKRKSQGQEVDKIRQFLSKLLEYSNQSVKNYNIKTNKQRQILNNFKEAIETQILDSKKEHEDKIEAIVEQGQQQFQQLQKSKQKQVKSLVDQTQQHLIEITKKLTRLQKQLREECQNRNENCQKLTDNIQEQIHNLKQSIQIEKQRRKNSEVKIYEMIEDVNIKLCKQIDNQSQKRKLNNNSLLKLIDLATTKLQERKF